MHHSAGSNEFQVPGDFEAAFEGSFDDLGFEEFSIEGDSEVVVIEDVFGHPSTAYLLVCSADYCGRQIKSIHSIRVRRVISQRLSWADPPSKREQFNAQRCDLR